MPDDIEAQIKAVSGARRGPRRKRHAPPYGTHGDAAKHLDENLTRLSDATQRMQNVLNEMPGHHAAYELHCLGVTSKHHIFRLLEAWLDVTGAELALLNEY